MTKYHSPFWLRGAHRQTTYPHLFRKVPAVDWMRERLYTPDGDFFDIDQRIFPDKPIVVLLHGLEGSSTSTYIAGTARYFMRAGWGVVALNMRSCSGEINRSLSFYHSGFTDDLDFLLNQLSNRHPQRPIFGLGFSLGGNIVLCSAGRSRADCQLQAVLAVSAPLDLSSSTYKMRAWPTRWYEQRFLRMLKRKVRQKDERLRTAGIDMESIYGAPTLRLFDRYLTAPTFGFVDEEDYYQQSSSLPLLPEIQVPTLLLQSYDDPMLSDKCYPNTDGFSAVSCLYTKQGGHVGFIHGQPWNTRYFVEEEAFRFFSSHLE